MQQTVHWIAGCSAAPAARSCFQQRWRCVGGFNHMHSIDGFVLGPVGGLPQPRTHHLQNYHLIKPTTKDTPARTPVHVPQYCQ